MFVETINPYDFSGAAHRNVALVCKVRNYKIIDFLYFSEVKQVDGLESNLRERKMKQRYALQVNDLKPKNGIIEKFLIWNFAIKYNPQIWGFCCGVFMTFI